ncbi:hypothetical protein ACOSP7_012995 [Xanthoceras sorbifolium]
MTWGHHLSSSTSLPTLCENIKMQSKVTTKTRISDNMAAAAPVAIGTRGTVGSLVRREIEYFSKFELERRAISFQKTRGQIVDMGSSSGHSRHGFWFMMMSWKRKKRRGSSSSGFLPSICSAAEVADKDRLNCIPGFNYSILKSDVNNLHI